MEKKSEMNWRTYRGQNSVHNGGEGENLCAIHRLDNFLRISACAVSGKFLEQVSPRNYLYEGHSD